MSLIISTAKYIYLHTASKGLRRLFYALFCWMVRGKEVVREIDGIRFKLDLGETIDLGIYLDRYEPHMKRAIARLCKPGHTVLDIGANVGAHALRFAKVVGPSGCVYAFEPTDFAFQKLQTNLSLNAFGNIHPEQVVLAERNEKNQVVGFRSSWPTDGRVKESHSRVDFVKLDDFLRERNVRHVDLIKLDVDGNEYSVIKGAENILKQHPVILMEVWGPNFSDPLRNPFVALKHLGYKFHAIDTDHEYATVEELEEAVLLKGNIHDAQIDIVAR